VPGGPAADLCWSRAASDLVRSSHLVVTWGNGWWSRACPQVNVNGPVFSSSVRRALMVWPCQRAPVMIVVPGQRPASGSSVVAWAETSSSVTKRLSSLSDTPTCRSTVPTLALSPPLNCPAQANRHTRPATLCRRTSHPRQRIRSPATRSGQLRHRLAHADG
jgi:hypothetical protein